MRKKEVRWISRDRDSNKVEIWRIKPKLKYGEYINPNPEVSCFEGLIKDICNIQLYTGLEIKRGGLAKVTIERMY
jgi:hypothetical protein